MKERTTAIPNACSAILITLLSFCNGIQPVSGREEPSVIQLPAPKLEGNTSVEKALVQRRSVREFAPSPIYLAQIGQLLWAAQGITKANFFRTAPSAGALYPLELFIAVGDVKDLQAGIYHYRPKTHDLVEVRSGDRREEICRAALNQESVARAPIVLIFAAIVQRTATKYGDRAFRYVTIEVGHAAQNVALQAISLNLATVTIGAFDDELLKKTIGCSAGEQVLYLMPIGIPLNQEKK